MRTLSCMGVRRVMGIETEYGISAPADPSANPMVMSGQVVTAYAIRPGTHVSRASWDYEDEAPLRDARGYSAPRARADPSQLTDRPGGDLAEELDDPTMANVVLTNGARLYVDHAHPEYSSPEVTNPLDAVRWDKAGELVMAEAARRVQLGVTNAVPGAIMSPIHLYKNNTDSKGASYGTHENYLMVRELPFAQVAAALIPFFVTRQVFTGAGRVSLGQRGETPGYQISQRADFMEAEVGLETTLRRPLVNTRDEPHASPDRYRRLHVICGDANLCEVATFLKVGTTALVLDLIEAGRMPDLALSGPVAAVRAISHDPTCRELVTLVEGSKLTAVQVQWRIFEAAAKMVEEVGGHDGDAQTPAVLDRWESVLTQLERDPMRCASELDWVAKLRLLDAFRHRDSLAWDDPRLAAIDLQYADVRPSKGLYQRLAARGSVERLLTDDQIADAVHTPPSDTRAFFRGECVRRYGAHVSAASWDSVIFDLPGQITLKRIPMMEPTRGTREHVGELLDQHEVAADLVAALGSAPR